MIVAPDATEAAIAAVARRRNLRLLLTGGMPDPLRRRLDVSQPERRLPGADAAIPGGSRAADLKVVTKRAPTEAELADLLFAFTVCKHVKSNAIVYAKDGATVGIGSGQPNRVDSARIAAWKSEEAARAGRPARTADRGQRRRLGRVLSVRGWVGGGGRGGCHGGDPARRLDPRRGGDRGGGRGGIGDGVHRNAAFPALTGFGSCRGRGTPTLRRT